MAEVKLPRPSFDKITGHSKLELEVDYITILYKKIEGEEVNPVFAGKIYDLLEVANKIKTYFDNRGIEDLRKHLTIKEQVKIYNIGTDFKDFANQDTLTTIRSGFGGSGGQDHPYSQFQGRHLYVPNRGTVDYWNDMTPEFLAGSFCTLAQWALISHFER